MKKIITIKPNISIYDNIDEFLYKFIIVFLVTLQIIIEIFNIDDYNIVMKPFILIVNILFFLFKTKKIITKKERFIQYSLVCSLLQVIVSLIDQKDFFIILRFVFSVFYIILSIICLKIETKEINLSFSQIVSIGLPYAICFMFMLSSLKIHVNALFPSLLYTIMLFIYVLMTNLRHFIIHNKSYRIVLASALLYSISEYLYALTYLNFIKTTFVKVSITISFQISQILIVFSYFNNDKSSSFKYEKIPISYE